MIASHNKITLKDVQGRNDLEAEVNWNEGDPLTNESKVLRFKLPDGRFSYIKRDQLHALLLVVGTREQKRDLIPQIVTDVRHEEHLFGIKATKDIRKGEEIVVKINLTVPIRKDRILGTSREVDMAGVRDSVRLPNGTDIKNSNQGIIKQ